MEEKIGENGTTENLQQRLQFIEECMQKMRDDGLTNLKTAQMKQKKHFDLKHKGPFYKVSSVCNKYLTSFLFKFKSTNKGFCYIQI